MAHVHQLRQTTMHDGNTVRISKEVRDDDMPLATHVTTQIEDESIAERIIWFAAGILEILLAFRFVLAILGANPANAFANFIYNVSHPFVAPFFGLFNYNTSYGVSRFEFYTLFAMLVYTVAAWILAELVTMARSN